MSNWFVFICIGNDHLRQWPTALPAIIAKEDSGHQFFFGHWGPASANNGRYPISDLMRKGSVSSNGSPQVNIDTHEHTHTPTCDQWGRALPNRILTMQHQRVGERLCFELTSM